MDTTFFSNQIRTIPDWPEPGIQFRDITPLLRDGEAFRALTGRTPDKTESKILAKLYTEQKTLFARNLQDAKKLLSTGESQRDETLPPADFAAMTTLVNAIMNYDEFVVQR